MKQVIVTIDQDGVSTTVETKGFQGAECLKEVEALEAALGDTASIKHTPEYRQARALATNTAKAQA